MEGLISGDVVILPFPFTDLQREKSRPALILGSFAEGSYIMCQITTQFQQGPHVLRLEHHDFTEGRLSKSSFVRVDKIFTILPKRVKGKPDVFVQPIWPRLINTYLTFWNFNVHKVLTPDYHLLHSFRRHLHHHAEPSENL